MIEQSTAAKAGTCPDCGTPTIKFRIKVGFIVHLEDHDIPINVDLNHPGVRHRVWNYLGPRLGWAPQYSPVRSWQPLRLQHECASHGEHPQEGVQA